MDSDNPPGTWLLLKLCS